MEEGEKVRMKEREKRSSCRGGGGRICQAEERGGEDGKGGSGQEDALFEHPTAATAEWREREREEKHKRTLLKHSSSSSSF